MSKPTTFSIRPGTADDVPQIAQISTDAFKDDTHTLMKHAASDQADEPMSMGDGAHYYNYLKMPAKVAVTVAVDDETGELLGHCTWGLWNYDGTKTKELQTPIPPHEPTLDPSRTKIEQLAAITDQSMAHWQATLSPYGVRTMYVLGISVDPKAQSRGVGSALIKWGADKADVDGVKIWVHSSEAGVKNFQKGGFEEVARLEIDLDEWASGPRMVDGKEEKWGSYRFRYMVREPKTV